MCNSWNVIYIIVGESWWVEYYIVIGEGKKESICYIIVGEESIIIVIGERR
jgi:hypothetical protein